MLSKKNLTREKKSPIHKQRRYAEFLTKTVLLSLLLTLFMPSCKKDDYEGEIKGICPLVISTDPADKAVSVVASKAISATFNESMNPATIDNKSFILMQGTTPIPGVVTAEDCPVVGSGYTGTFYFTPTSPLAPFTLYTVTMKKGVRDHMRNAMQKDYVWSFTTQPQLILSSNPLIGGTTMGSGLFNVGSSVTAIAIPAVGYSFKNWTEGTTIVSTNADYSFPLVGNRTLVANFTVAPVQYTVALSSNPLAGGTTTGGGSFDLGAAVAITAVPSPGYFFKNWTEGATIVSTDAYYTFTVTTNRSLVANFVVTHTVTLLSNPLTGGSVDGGGGTYETGSLVRIIATPAVGYTFTNWTEGSTIVSTESNYLFTITANRNLVANFITVVVPPVGPGIINLGAAASYSILTMSGISSTGVTSVQGDIGVSPATATAITGFGLIMDIGGQSAHTTIPTHVTGKVYAADYATPTPANLSVAVSNVLTAYTTANNLVIPAPVIGLGTGNVGGLTLAPGLYKWSTGVDIASGTTLTLSGGVNDTWVFQIAADLTLNPAAKVSLIGGAQAKNITWVVAGQAVLGTNTVFYGNILSKTLISLNTGAVVTGRLFAQTAVTLNTSTVIKP